MIANPVLGVFFHWLGGLASASFYVPFRKVKGWSWETYWLAGGVFSWIVAPLAIAGFMTNDLFGVLRETPGSTVFWCYFFGVLWGFGGLTFGLTLRYLGMSLGMAVALGYCAAFGTLGPPIFRGEFASMVLGTRSGVIILIGVAICVSGIAIAGLAGMSKEKEMPVEQQKAVIQEFNLKKGIVVATFCGIMSACFSYGLAAGEPIKALTLRHGTSTLWQGLPVLVIVLLGGFTTNVVWCVILNVRNRTQAEYFESRAGKDRSERIPLLTNYIFCAVAGTIWYFQFFFYTMGETQMGVYKFSSWTLHMASIMIFGSLWGLGLKEWKGAGTRTMTLLTLSLAVLVTSTVVVGYGNYVGLVPEGNRNVISTGTRTRTAVPSQTAGLKRHERTAPAAFASSPQPSL
ncbi:MAG TPA: L-rhamnose/proton symporter RhaT [Bryobacteraceae bacterium]|nr:L-rhamnose/proton symporter RhaT [Bryobacteraceae bacterium]